jgi:Peptidase family M23/LysM domain
MKFLYRSLHLQRVRRLAAMCAAALVMVALLTVDGGGAVAANTSGRAPARVPACAKTYDVVAGDFWVKIAQKSGVSIASLFAINNATASTPLFPGNQLCLPEASVATTTIVPTTTLVPPVVLLASFPVQGPCWFTDTWMAPRGGGRRHEGVDLIAKAGLYVYAAQDGTLSKQTLDKTGSLSGNAWWLSGTDGTYFFYAHLSAFAPDLKVGSKVVAGQIIGFVGRTGNAAGPHLHFEVHPGGGAAVNPTPIVKAVDGCKNTTPPVQPNGALPPTPSTLAPASQAPTTTAATPSVAPTTTAAPVSNGPVGTAPVNAGPTPTIPLSSAAGPLWQFFSPKTAFDTTWNGRALSAGARQTIRVNNLAGVPTATSGVMLRISATSTAGAGYLVTHRCDTGAPLVSTLSFAAGGSAVGTSMVAVVAGNVCLTTSASARVKVEVIAARAANGVGLQPVSAARALDTRVSGVRIGPGSSVSISPAALGVVSGTQALSATVTLVNPAAAGTLSLGFCGQGPWTTPFSGDAVSSFAITMRVNTAGWCLTSSVATDVIVDVVGNWGAGTPPAPVDPTRLFDSRSAGSPVGLNDVTVPVAGVGSVPGGATSAVLAITTVAGGTGATVFAVPCGEGRSSGSVIATTAGRVTTVVVPVRLGGGAVCISALQAIDVIVDAIAAG